MIANGPADDAGRIVYQQCAAQHQYMQAADEGRRDSSNKPLCSHTQPCSAAGGEHAGVQEEINKAGNKLHVAKVNPKSLKGLHW